LNFNVEIVENANSGKIWYNKSYWSLDLASSLLFQIFNLVILFKKGTYYRVCELAKRVKVTHDTDVYYLNLPFGCRMRAPIGYHVFMKLPDGKFLKNFRTIKSQWANCLIIEISYRRNRHKTIYNHKWKHSGSK
jgi:hypothetical protein